MLTGIGPVFWFVDLVVRWMFMVGRLRVQRMVQASQKAAAPMSITRIAPRVSRVFLLFIVWFVS